MPERFEIYIVYKRRYINTLPFLFSFPLAEPVVHIPVKLFTGCCRFRMQKCVYQQMSRIKRNRLADLQRSFAHAHCKNDG